MSNPHPNPIDIDAAEPKRSRAVFSTEDFTRLRASVAHYMRQDEIKEGPDLHKYSALYHRLGRVG